MCLRFTVLNDAFTRRDGYTSNQIFCVAIRFIAHFTFVSSFSVRFYRFCWIYMYALLCVNSHIVCTFLHLFFRRLLLFLGMECRVKRKNYTYKTYIAYGTLVCVCMVSMNFLLGRFEHVTCLAHPFVRERVNHMRYTTGSNGGSDSGSYSDGGGIGNANNTAAYIEHILVMECV